MRNNLDHFQARDRCPVCASDERTILFDAPMCDGAVHDFIAHHFAPQGSVDWELLAGTDFTLAECRRCALIYQTAAPTPDTLKAIYTEMIDQAFLEPHERSLLTVAAFNGIAGELGLLFERLGKPAGQITFLDYGFGYGRWARVARALGATVYATEIGEDKARAAAALGVEMIDDDQLDAMRFDIVHAEQVFEHLTEPGETFRRLARATDGLFKVAVPRPEPIAAVLHEHGMARESPFARGGRQNAVDRAYMAIQPLEHLNVFAPETMRYLADSNGLNLVSRSRRTAVTANLTSIRGLAASAVGLAKALHREVFRHRSGYYLFRPA